MNTNTRITVRPPVVAVLGHIDHGKSTLLDYIRKSNVDRKEAGGITQRLSAYEVLRKNSSGEERALTFIDTPGHEAFKGVRTRGAGAADIAVLVVSAEDGVKLQTIEAYKTIQKSKIPYIVAINKIDKPGADLPKTKSSLIENEIYLEGLGGDIPYVEISAKTGAGIDALLDLLLLVADLADLKTDTSKIAEGIVLEAHSDGKKGISTTLIIKDGTLKKNTFLASGGAFTPVRNIENFAGENVESLGAGSPAKISGWSDLPKIGYSFSSFESKKEAEETAHEFQENEKRIKKALEEGESTEGKLVIPIIVKADLEGSAEAVMHEIKKIPAEKILLKIVSSSAGNITEADVKFAMASEGAVILGFNTKTDSRAKDLALREGVALQTFDVIYHLTQWLQKLALERTPRSLVEEKRGELKVLKIFSVTKNKQVIGGKVLHGLLSLKDEVRIFRREAYLGVGNIDELQQGKMKTSKVEEGNECGLLIDSKIEIAPGDTLEAINLVEQ
ncbi:MAG: translation initiation factor IF-2 [Patescibacteria group bacterium]